MIYVYYRTLGILYFFLVDKMRKIESQQNFPISSVWIILCFYTLLLPRLFLVGIIPTVVILFIILYYLFIHEKLNKGKLTLQSIQIIDKISLLTHETITERYLLGNAKNLPHIVGLIFSCTLYVTMKNKIIVNSEIAFAFALFSYIFVMSLIIVRRLLLRFPLDSVVEKIIVSGFVVINNENLSNDPYRIIRKIRTVLIIKEILIQTFIVIFVSILLNNYIIPTTNIPLCFASISLSLIFIKHCKIFFEKFTNFFLVHYNISLNSFEFEDVNLQKDKLKTMDWKQRICFLINPFTSLRKFIVLLFGFLTVIVKIVNSIDAINKIIDFFKNFIH